MLVTDSVVQSRESPRDCCRFPGAYTKYTYCIRQKHVCEPLGSALASYAVRMLTALGSPSPHPFC